MKDISSIAAALYEGGWRPEDAEQIREEYGLTKEETEEIVKLLKEYE